MIICIATVGIIIGIIIVSLLLVIALLIIVLLLFDPAMVHSRCGRTLYVKANEQQHKDHP